MKDTAHLPKNEPERRALIQKIQAKLEQIGGSPGSEKEEETLQLRLKLIEDCGDLSVVRIEHLQQIFKHYCTHIFKIGKHMTFQRLEYEKVHLTLDRLCVFLKDFGLTTTTIEDHQEEVLDKQQIVRYFKRLSKNCRDLSFQEFIACLQKLAIVYYDGKENFRQKKQKQKEERQKRIIAYKKRMKKKKIEAEQEKAFARSEEKEKEKEEGDEGAENDDLVKGMMEDQNLEDPNQEVKKAAGEEEQKDQKGEQKVKKQGKSKVLSKPGQNTVPKETRPEFELTIEEKIEFYYQMIGVDNVHDFRKKMSELNLPLFQQYKQKKASSTKQSKEIHVVIQENDKQDQRRLIELREKLNMKKQRDKSLHSPMLSKQQYEQRKRKREEKQEQLMRQVAASRAMSRFSTHAPKKKIDLSEREMSLDMLNHISFDDLKNKFNPTKYFSAEDSDRVFLNQYGPEITKTSSRKPSKSGIKDKTASTMEFKKRNSSNIVQNFKKRAHQLEAKQFYEEAEMSKFINKFKNRPKIQFN